MLEWAAVRTWNTHHVAKRGEDDIGLFRDGKAVIDSSHREHAHGTARPMNQFDVGRQKIFKAEAVDGVGVPPAHFHEAVVTPGIGKTADLVSGLGDQLRFAKLVDKSHTFTSRPSLARRLFRFT